MYYYVYNYNYMNYMFDVKDMRYTFTPCMILELKLNFSI